MNTVKKVASFVKEFVALAKGEDTIAQGQRIFRQADSALNIQIQCLKGDTIRFEDDLKSAETHLSNARVNHGHEISDRDAYVENLLEAFNRVATAKEEIEIHEKKLAFLTEQLASLTKEVEIEG